MTTPFSSEKLLKELDKPGTVNWALELKHRSEAYTFLRRAVLADQLNQNQFHNALHALFRIAFPENVAEVLQILVGLSAHPSIAIRSEAVQLAIGLVRLSTSLETPLLFSSEQKKSVKEAMARGLTPKVENLARGFFTS